jgi:hypothetical protein
MLPPRGWNPDSTMLYKGLQFKSAHYEFSNPVTRSPNGRPLEPPAVHLAGLSGSNSMTRSPRARHPRSTTARRARGAPQCARRPPSDLVSSGRRDDPSCWLYNAIPFTCERSAPKGQGAHPAQRAGRGSKVMATLTLALVRCYGLFCRALPGHAAGPRHQPECRPWSPRFC